MSKKCPWCKVDVYLTELKHWYKCPECQTEFPERAFPKEITVFDRLTASMEVLAENSVYVESEHTVMVDGSEFGATFPGGWTSPFIEYSYGTKEEAIAATVEKLKEDEK